MASYLPFVLFFSAIVGKTICITSKTDFIEEETDSLNSTSVNEDGDDVEVKHTIVVSTKLKNNNHRGIIDGTIASAKRKSTRNEDSSEVPIFKAYKSVETTQIRTPDSTRKASAFANHIPISRSSRDDQDIYPNLALSPMQWKPSSFYNNVNWAYPENNGFSSFNRRFHPDFQNNYRRTPEDNLKEFYCGKCVELNGFSRGLTQQRSPWIQNQTPKVKIDGKIAKLN